MREPWTPLLSFCIAAHNRADLIGETLESIISQANDECEIVVLDGASTDDTEAVVGQFAQRFGGLRYIKQAYNTGLDAGYDEAVTAARGKYCWLMSSKDLLKPGAIPAVLEQLRGFPSLVVVNMEIRDLSLSTLMVPQSVSIEAGRVYESEEADQLFSDTFSLVNHISCSVVLREIWLSRERSRYFGSQHTLLGVVFQKPLPGKAIFIADVLVCHRFGGQSWVVNATRWAMLWPSVVRSLALSEPTKKRFARSGHWNRARDLLYLRAFGWYSLREYRISARPHLRSFRERLIPALVALLPGRLVNALLLWLTKGSTAQYRTLTLLMLRSSRFYLGHFPVYTRN